jgi:hypothetical protein
MTPRFRFILHAGLNIASIAAAFGCGWLAYGYQHSETRRFPYSVAAPFMAPRGYSSIGLLPSHATACFTAGDRVDLLIVVDGKAEPLVLDALVTGNTNTNFGLLVRYQDDELIRYILQLGRTIVFRSSITPREAEYTHDFQRAQEEFRRLRADGRIEI